MQKICTKHLFWKLCSSYHLKQLFLACLLIKSLTDQRRVSCWALSHSVCNVSWTRPNVCTLDPFSYLVVLMLCSNTPGQRRSVSKVKSPANFCLNNTIISAALVSNSLHVSVFCSNNAPVHRCIIDFIISDATTWTDDQIRLIAPICMFLLESCLWQEKRLFF